MFIFSSTLAELLIFRFIVGLGIGVAANVVPVYVAETSPSNIRGSLVTVINLCITSGQFISYLVNSAFVTVNGGWKYMLGLAAVPAILQFIGIIFILPESPRFFLAKNRIEEAKNILKKIRGKENVDLEINEILTGIKEESGGTLKELFQSKAMQRPLFLGVCLQIFQQFCGINTAMYYSATILKMAGFTSDKQAVWFSTLVAFTNAFFTVVALYFIDRVGRRKLLLTTMVGVIFGLAFLGLSFLDSIKVHFGIYAGYLALASLIFYVAFFAIGLGPIPWAVNAEIYPTHVRGLANGIATTANWSSNLLISITFLSYIKLVSASGAFFTYTAVAVVGFVLFLKILPETKGKTPEEISSYWRTKKN